MAGTSELDGGEYGVLRGRDPVGRLDSHISNYTKEYRGGYAVFIAQKKPLLGHDYQSW
jgi:hypothetical protein